MFKYFAYGSNMSDRRMAERKFDYVKRERAILKGYKLVFNKQSYKYPEVGYANIVKGSIDDIVEGVVYYFTDESLIKNLDKAEGYPNHYTKRKITLEVFSENERIYNNERNVIVYIANPDKQKQGLKPTNEYLEYLLEGKEFLTTDYLNKLQIIETISNGR